jgi:RNA polymerase sigma factor (sigma-70 family)
MKPPFAPAALPSRSDLAHLVARVWPTMRRIVRRVLGANDPEHDDVLQSAVERLLITLYDARLRDGSTLQLAAILARNVAVDARRARARRMRISLCDEAATAVANDIHPERVASARELLAHYARALDGLRPAHAEVVYAHDVLGCDLAEIATMFGLSISAAQSRLVRGRGRVAVVLRVPPSPTASIKAIATTRAERPVRPPRGDQPQPARQPLRRDRRPRRRLASGRLWTRRHTTAARPRALHPATIRTPIARKHFHERAESAR